VVAGLLGLVIGGVGMWIVQASTVRNAAHTEEADGHAHTARRDPSAPASHSGHDEDEHDAHGHGLHEEGTGHHDEDDHDTLGHPRYEDHGEHGDTAVVELTAAQHEAFGISLAVARRGSLTRAINLPGQIVINADRVAHIVPRSPGVARHIKKTLGDPVVAGEVMAVLESTELSEAKTHYLATLRELSCCSIDLARAEGLETSTQKLLALLDTSPTLDTLRTTRFTELGEAHSKLVSAYAQLVYTKAEYEREVKLRDQNISSKADFEAATNAYKKAGAEYAAMRGSVAFETRRNQLEARRSRQGAELAAEAAERKLRVLGLTADEVALLRKALDAGTSPAEEECSDPNCKDCVAHRAGKAAESNALGEKLGLYSLRAPFRGTVIQKHISLGEQLSDDADAFTIADTSTVWVELNIYQKDLPYVRKGQAVVISAGEGVPDVEGTLSYVSPVMDEATRTIPARVVLDNTSGLYRPGLFVTARVSPGDVHESIVVRRTALQVIDEEPCVFVPVGDGFTPRPVVLGHTDGVNVEIVGGLDVGQQYVEAGAFELKAHMVTATMDAHAGHGH
jgi:RND family efflux transporter MFP subunit